MTTIKATIRNGRIEVDEPIDLPDGTELMIPLPAAAGALSLCNEEGFNTPEAIAAWMRWYDALEPLEFTEQERAAWEAARLEQKQYELAQWDRRSQQIEGHFQ